MRRRRILEVQNSSNSDENLHGIYGPSERSKNNLPLYSLTLDTCKSKAQVSESKNTLLNLINGGSRTTQDTSIDDEDVVIINDERNIVKNYSQPERGLNDFNSSNESFSKDFSILPIENSSTPRYVSDMSRVSTIKDLELDDLFKKVHSNAILCTGSLKDNDKLISNPINTSKNSSFYKNNDDFKKKTLSSYSIMKDKIASNNYNLQFYSKASDDLTSNPIRIEKIKERRNSSLSSSLYNFNNSRRSSFNNINPSLDRSKMFLINEEDKVIRGTDKLWTHEKTKLFSSGSKININSNNYTPGRLTDKLNNLPVNKDVLFKPSMKLELQNNKKSNYGANDHEYQDFSSPKKNYSPQITNTRLSIKNRLFNTKTSNIQNSDGMEIYARNNFPASTISAMPEDSRNIQSSPKINYRKNPISFRYPIQTNNYRMLQSYKNNSYDNNILHKMINGFQSQSESKIYKFLPIIESKDMEKEDETLIMTKKLDGESESNR